MHTEVLYQPAYALCRIALSPGETVRAESGAMVSMDGGIRVETKATGGIMTSLGRSFLGGESFFQNTFHADTGGELTVAPSLPGDIMVLELAGHEITVQSGSYLASSPEITVESTWGGGEELHRGHRPHRGLPISMPYQVQKVGSWKSSLLGGEGFVRAFQGPGDLYLQTRSPESFLSGLIPQLPSRSSN